MAGHLGSLNSFHSFRENKTALWAHPLVMLMLLLRPLRIVCHMEKQSLQRFTTGILTQQETRRRKRRVREERKEEGIDIQRPDNREERQKKRGKSEAQSPEAGKVVYMQTEGCITGE